MTTESGEKRKRGSASPDPTPDANADPTAAAAPPPLAPHHPRPVAPPRPLGTEEDLSHGQRPASDAARADRGVPFVAAAEGANAAAAAAAADQAPAPPPAAAATAAAPAAKLLVPGHSAWFRYYAVHRLERESLPEWFDGRQGGGEEASSGKKKTPESYLKLRNLLVDAYREDPLRRLTYTEARARAAAAASASSTGGEASASGSETANFDAASVLRLHSFLDHWGILNFQAPPPAEEAAGAASGAFGGRGYYQKGQGQQQQQELAGPPAALLTRVAGGGVDGGRRKRRPLPPGTEAVFSFPPASVAAGVAAAGGTGVPPGLAALAGRKDRYGRSLGGGAPSAAWQQQRKVKYFCSAMPWVDCTAARYHCTRVPDVDLSPAAFADGRFPPGCSAKDFVRIDGGGPAPLPGAEAAAASAASDAAAPIDPGTRPAAPTTASAGDWTDAETLALLEGIELFGEDWAEVAAHVGSRSAFACVRRFLALPLADEFLAELEAPARARGVLVKDAKAGEEKRAEEGEDDEEEIPFADAGNPVMAQVAFLSHMVGPRVAAAAAARALEVLTEEEEGEDGKEKAVANGDGTSAGPAGGDNNTLGTKQMRAAAAAGLAAAAVKARLLADAEEREVVRLAGVAAAALSARIEAKVAALDDLEKALDGERAAAEAARDAAFAERRAMALARVEGAAAVPLPQ